MIRAIVVFVLAIIAVLIFGVAFLQPYPEAWAALAYIIPTAAFLVAWRNRT